MGLKDWRTRHRMADPVRGEFRITGSYFPHPGSTPIRTMLTGVVVADGVPPTPAEHLDRHATGEFRPSLPVLVDRADPGRFVVLWDEIPTVDPRAEARQRAEDEARRMRLGGGDAGTVGGGGVGPRPAPGPVTVDGVEQLPPWVQRAVAAALAGDETPVVVSVHGADSGVVPPTPPGWRAAAAVLTAVTDVAVPAYALPGATASLCDLTVRITRPDGSSYLTSTRMGFRAAERRARLAVLGSLVPLVVDPTDETHVAIDVPAWDAATR